MKEPVATLSFNGKSFDFTQRQLSVIADGVMKNADRSYPIDFNKILNPLAVLLEDMATYTPPVDIFEFDSNVRSILVPFSFDTAGQFNLFDTTGIGDPTTNAVNIERISVSSALVANVHFDERVCGSTADSHFGQAIEHDNLLLLGLVLDGSRINGQYVKDSGEFTFSVYPEKRVDLILMVSYSPK